MIINLKQNLNCVNTRFRLNQNTNTIMRTLYLILASCLILTSKLIAQNVEGQIFYKDDTITATFKLPVSKLSKELNYMKLQTKLKYYDSLGVKTILRPEDALEIRFRYQHQFIRMVSLEDNLELRSLFSEGSNIFLRIKVDGKLKLYYYYYNQGSSGGYSPSTGMTGGYSYGTSKYILQKGDGKLKSPRGLGFKISMAEYFEDCPELVKKIMDKEFKKNDLDEIVSYYNRHCK